MRVADEFRWNATDRTFDSPASKPIAWDAYQEGRKAPITRRAGPGYVDPDYELSVDWLEAKERIERAQATWASSVTPSRVLLINGSPRNYGTCPGEMSKTYRLQELAREVIESQGIQVDVLDLSLLSSEYGRQIHPCKACVSSAMPLCRWPCSCYPNHSLRQTGDRRAFEAVRGVVQNVPYHSARSSTQAHRAGTVVQHGVQGCCGMYESPGNRPASQV